MLVLVTDVVDVGFGVVVVVDFGVVTGGTVERGVAVVDVVA